MARTRLPDALKRRHLIEQDLAAEPARRIAEAYLEQERRIEALAFLHKAGDRERLVALRAEAVAEGDVFLLRQVVALLGEEPGAAEWSAVAAAAAAAGKERYAVEARRQQTAKED